VSIISGSVFLLVPFVTYLLFYLGLSVKAAFIIIIIANALLCLTNVGLVQFYCKVNISPFLNAIGRVLVTSLVALLLCLYIKSWIPPIRIHMITNSVIAVSIVILSFFILCFNRDQRQFAVGFIRTKLHLK